MLPLNARVDLGAMVIKGCYGADKRVDSANKLSVKCVRVRVCMAKDNGGRQRRRDNRYNKSDDFIAGITNVYVNVRGGCDIVFS